MKKVLAVDDNLKIHEMLKIILEDKNYEALFAIDGKEGVRIAKSQKPDVILMDVDMPEMNGFEALKKIKDDPETQNIPVIMLTFRQAHGDIEKAIQEKAENYIPKPFEAEDLVQAIEQAVK